MLNISFDSMKTQFTLIVFLLSIATFLSAQNVPNGSFEEWEDGEPLNWTTSNAGGIATISQSDDSHSGSYAVMGQTNPGETIIPELLSGYDNLGIPVSEKYELLKFHYKYNEDGSDKMVIAIIMYDEDYSTLGSGGLEIEDEVEDYTLAVIPITYDESGTPAHAAIQIGLVDGFGSGPPSADSYFIIDDVEFSGSVGIDEINTENTRILISPQPATDVARISFTSDTRVNNLNLSIIDPSGKRMGEYKFGNTSSGMNEVMIDISHFAPGVYIALINTDGESFTKKMIIK